MAQVVKQLSGKPEAEFKPQYHPKKVEERKEITDE
jgi:hypothetical protein